jgi:SAM-dependent methyltransferase
MSSSQKPSLPPSYFDQMYRKDPDPWQFETSDYEAQKYAATIATLPRDRYRSAFEIGGSIGVLTRKLAARCDSLLSVDVSETAQARAIQRCQDLSHVHFQIMQVPDRYPDETFDLVVLSEVGYYWCWDDLKKAQQQILASLEPGGHLLLVHWTPYAADYPLRGDDVHDSFFKWVPEHLHHLTGQRQELYRLDLFERTAQPVHN